MIGRAHQRKLE